jgi:hypothetical protein
MIPQSVKRTAEISLRSRRQHKASGGSEAEPEEQAQQGERAREEGGRRGAISLSPAKAGSDLIGDGYPGVTLAALAHPGLNSAAAPRLVDPCRS